MAGILHLGNVHFDAGSGKMDSESCSIPSSDESLNHFAELFEIEEDQIRSWLCNRKIVTARESYVKPVGAEAVKFAHTIKISRNIYLIFFNCLFRLVLQEMPLPNIFIPKYLIG